MRTFRDVRYSLILVGINFALAFPSSVFSGLLWGYERFDLQNAVNVPALVLRAVLSLTVVSTTTPLISLGAIVLSVATLSTLAKILLCHRLSPNFKISLRNIRKSRVPRNILCRRLDECHLLVPQLIPRSPPH